MEVQRTIRLGRPIKVAKDTCIVCGTKQWKCYNSIHSNQSRKKNIPVLLQLYCHVDIARGGMCNGCERSLLRMNHRAEEFRSSCHKTLLINKLVSTSSLAQTGFQSERTKPCSSLMQNITWPGKENLFVALAVCKNLPSALQHTITTENYHPPMPINQESSKQEGTIDHNYFKPTAKICIKAECFSQPALIPLSNENHNTALPLARLAAIKIGEMMGTGSLGSAKLTRHIDQIASTKNKELENVTPVKKTPTNEEKSDGRHVVKIVNHDLDEGDICDGMTNSMLRYTSVEEIVKEADWLHKGVRNSGHSIRDIHGTAKEKSVSRGGDQSTCNESKPKKKKVKKVGDNIAIVFRSQPEHNKDIIHWESQWRKQNSESVYFICPMQKCGEMVLESEQTLHSDTHRVDVDGFFCSQCDFQHNKWSTMKNHLYSNHFKVKQTCSCDQRNCDQKFSSFVNLRQHMIHVHSFKSALQRESKKVPYQETEPEEPLTFDVCSICGIACKLEDRVAHEADHIVPGDIQMRCKVCETVMPANQIKDHVLAMHRKKTYLYQCDACTFTSQTLIGLKRHVGIKHVNAIVFVCDKCGKGFKTAAALKVHHKRVHVTQDEKTVLCSTCGYLCAHETLLKEHVRKVHSKPSWRRFKCPLCEHFSLRESSLERHMQIYHNQSEERQFKCSICPYTSKTKANLVRHQRTHKEYNSFQCPHCDFAGSKKSILQEHISAKHAKATPLSCAICGSIFSYLSTLTSHMARHKANGDTPLERVVVPHTACHSGNDLKSLEHVVAPHMVLHGTSDGKPAEYVEASPIPRPSDHRALECIINDEEQDRLYFQL